MGVLKRKRISLNGIKRIAILADAGCREGWEKNFPRLLKKVWREYHPQLFIVAGDLALHGTDNEYKCIYAIVDSCELGQDMNVHGYNPNPKEAPHSWTLSAKSIPYTRFYKKA